MIRTVYFFIRLIEQDDTYTANHLKRVANLAVDFAKYLDCSQKEIEIIKYGSSLHDIGKLGIPDKVIKKKGKLTEEEFSKIKEHPLMGYEAVKNLNLLEEQLQIILHHHERIDGKGYPSGLTGDEITPYCKIVTICDCFDAMTNDRVYKSKLSYRQALLELELNKGTQFDPYFTQRFIEFITKRKEVFS